MKLQFLFLICCCACYAGAWGQSADDVLIRSIELRNYTLLPGMRDKFSSYMDRIIIPRQGELGGYLMNAFSLNQADDHYVWIRGFASMQSRSKFMKDFYYSDYWKQHAAECNSMLVDSYDVHLLKPLVLKGAATDSTTGIRLGSLKKPEGITIATYYVVTKGRRNDLIKLMANGYVDALKKGGAEVLALLISETQENDYTRQHVYQDPDLLVVLSHFRDSTAYQSALKLIPDLTPDALKKSMKEILISSDSHVLYPLRH